MSAGASAPIPRSGRSPRRFELCLAGILIAAVVCGCQRDPQAEKQRRAAAGDQYVAAGKVNEAIIEYRSAIQEDPRAADVREKLADVSLQVGDTQTALREYVRAADLAPQNLPLQLKAATLLLASGQFEDARTRAELVLASDDKNVTALLLRANAFIGLKDLDTAIRQIQDAIDSNPNRGEMYTNLGAIELAQGKQDSAESSFKRAVELAPNSVQAQLALGNFYWLSGKWPEAEQALKAAVQVDPRDQIANRALGNYFLATNRYTEAEAPLKTVADVSRDPKDIFALADYYMLVRKPEPARALLETLVANEATKIEATTRIAAVEHLTGHQGAAYAHLNAILDVQPTDERALLVKARLLLIDRRYEEALTTARKALVTKNSAPAHMLIATAQVALRQSAGAITSYQEVLRLNPRATDARLALAKLQLARGDASTSLDLAREVLRSAPDNEDARLTAARALLESGDLVQAERELTRLVAKYPDSAVVHTEMGMLYGRQEKAADARLHLNRALELQSSNTRALIGLVALDLQSKRTADVRLRADGLVKSQPTPEMFTLAARFYGAVGDRDAAERTLKQALEKDAGYLPAYLALGQLYVSMGRLAAARTEFETISTQSKNPIAALTMIGLLLQAEGNVPEATKQYEKVLNLDPSAFVAANNLAWIYAESRTDLEKALALARRAHEQQPKNASANDTLGYLLTLTNQPDRAVQPLEDAVAAQPANPVYHYHLGKAYALLGRIDPARHALTTALKLNASFDGSEDASQLLGALGTP